MTTEIVEAAANYLQQGGCKPKPADVVSALLTLEKQYKKSRLPFSYEDFLGKWRLGFVSGTKTVRPRSNALPIKQVGKGLFLPKLIKVEITYSKGNPNKADAMAPIETTGLPSNKPNVRLNNGTNDIEINGVENAVSIGPLHLCLTGPTRYWPKPNAIAFDFTNIAVSLGGWTPYNGAVRGGNDPAKFKAQSLKDQAFFTFFVVEAQYIAARGKGGGLALWTRSDI